MNYNKNVFHFCEIPDNETTVRITHKQAIFETVPQIVPQIFTT